MRTIYFDYNATTPLDADVREAMAPFLDRIYGNPSSVHHIGREARALLDEARDRVAQVFQSKPSEVVFTSGGTESNNLAIFGVARLLRSKGSHLITTQVEHHAVLHAFRYLEEHEGFEVTYLPVDATGRVDPETVRKAIRPDTVLVSVMAANNEVGVELVDVGERQLAESLDGIAVEENPALPAECSDLGDRLDGSDLVVRGHDRNQHRVGPEAVLH